MSRFNNNFFNDKPFNDFNNFFDNNSQINSFFSNNDNNPSRVVNYSISYGNGDNKPVTYTNYNNKGFNVRNDDNFGFDRKPKQRYHVGWQDPKTKTVDKPSGVSKGTIGSNNTASVTKKGLINDTEKKVKFLDQDYESIKQRCMRSQTLWEDEYFPANMNSLFPSGESGGWRNFEWKRPGEICDNPKMFVGGHGRFDVAQGELGNCWFLAALASLCSVKNNKIFERVFPEDNHDAYDKHSYAGIMKFHIWQYGRWTEVVIDDRLPTYNGRLVFVHSDKNNEFWPALIEKAYAKINGSYEALQGGNVGEAMVDFTGGIVNPYNLAKQVPKDFFKIMKQAFDRDSLLGCSIDPQVVGGTIEGKLANGLISGHAYSITGLRSFNHGSRPVQLIRVRNPWGNEDEWKGSWSDGSPEWNMLSEQEKKSLELTFEDDGEFWITIDDFVRNFTNVEICMGTPKHSTSTSKNLTWVTSCYEGSWKSGVNAGGCRNHLNTFATNPQYIVEVVDADEDNDVDEGTVIISLLQKDRRKLKNQLNYLYQQQEMLTIGYYIYKIPENHDGVLDVNFFKYNLSTAKSPSFCNSREMVGRHTLVPGKYAVIPTTFAPNQNGDFLLRIFSEKAVDLKEADESTRFVDNPEMKVKEDMPVYGNDDKQKGLRGMVPADSEIKRAKTLLVTPEEMNETQDIKALFKRISGVDLEVDPYELKSILDEKFTTEFKFEGFSIETTRSMVAMMDTDHSGKLGYDKFKQLWKDILFWKKVFVQYNNSSLSTLGSYELRSALNSAGFLVSNQTFKCLSMRYSDSKGLLYFNDFVHLAVRLKTMFAIYDELIRSKSTDSILTLDQFIQTTMYS